MDLKCNTPADVLKAAKDHKVKMVDVKFVDMPGMWQHFSVPTHELEIRHVYKMGMVLMVHQ